MDSFRLICLRNCTVKIIEKILTQRLQREISGTTDSNQTGFLRGRSISETFIFVLTLYSVVSRKKVPALVIKLDFTEAFDMVNRESLQAILMARGFNNLWCTLIQNILQAQTKMRPIVALLFPVGRRLYNS